MKKNLSKILPFMAITAIFCLALVCTPAPVLAEHPNAFGRPTADNPQPGNEIMANPATRPTGWKDQTRSEVVVRNGIVATSQPLAAQAGLKILQDGGNAVDAAVATAAMLALTEPGSTGLGGDLFAQVWSAKDQKLYGVSASGWSPAAWSLEYFNGLGFDETTGMPSLFRDGLGIVNAVVVPGAVSGWDILLKDHGTMTFKEVLEPAARYAEEGYPLHEVMHNTWKLWSDYGLLSIDPDTADLYLPVPELYSIVRNPDMGRTFRILQKKGADAFYKGEIADAMVAKIQALGGVMTKEDLAEYSALRTEPVSINYKGYDFSQLPPPGQGWAALEMLNILEVCVPYHGYDLAALGRPNPRFTHFEVEAKKLAYSDLHRYNADPAFAPPPLETLLSKEYALSLCDLIDPDQARPADVEGNMGGTDTIYLAAADRWGNMVSLVYSVFWPFGSGITVPGYGFQLANRGAGFSLEPVHPNVVDGRKRPFITIIAGFIMKDGEPLMAMGNMGGGTQPQAHAQHLVNMIDLGYNVQATTDAARFDHEQYSDVLSMDYYLYNAVADSLTEWGHVVNSSPSFGLGGGYQGIYFERDPDMPEPAVPGGRGGRGIGHQQPVNGFYRCGSDLRKDGLCAGW